jgi:hypothetical protein
VLEVPPDPRLAVAVRMWAGEWVGKKKRARRVVSPSPELCGGGDGDFRVTDHLSKKMMRSTWMLLLEVIEVASAFWSEKMVHEYMLSIK